jgi:hypothetical protein
MTAGMNIRVKVWRISTDDDDSVGGAMITGTVVYSGIQAFMQEAPMQMLLAQQGLEVLSVFNMTLVPGTLTIYERDEIEVEQPKDHYYYGQRFRVMSSRYSSHNPRDARNYLMLTVTRSDRMHRQQ